MFAWPLSQAERYTVIGTVLRNMSKKEKTFLHAGIEHILVYQYCSAIKRHASTRLCPVTAFTKGCV